MIKMTPNITVDHLKWVKQFNADKVFVFDVAMVDQDFIDQCPVPVVWLDHHEILDRTGAVYINARMYGEMTPPCIMAYQVCAQDLWIACIGTIGDWYWSDLLFEFQKQYPDLLEMDLNSVKGRPEEVMFNTRLGTLVHVLSFNLKGVSKDALASVKLFSKIESPLEILQQTTEAGASLWKKYQKVKTCYDQQKESALKSYDARNPFFVHTYTSEEFSVTKDLANELSYLHKDKVIVLARERNGEMVMSLRSSRDGPELHEALARVLPSFVGAHGGGHEHACGAAVKSEDFKNFLEAFRKELGL